MPNTLHFFYGTMASGKSSSLIQEHYNFTQKNADAWVIKAEQLKEQLEN